VKNLCGECNVCCIKYRIPKEKMFWRDTDKERYEACDKLRKNQCSLYEKRPDPCKNFECLWLQLSKKGKEDFKTEWRPDRIGFVVKVEQVESKVFLTIEELEKDSANLQKLNQEQDSFIQKAFELKGKIYSQLDQESLVLFRPYRSDKRYKLVFGSKEMENKRK